MLALLYALYIVGGRATYEELQILLEHRDAKSVRSLVSKAEAERLVRRPRARGGLVELVANGTACVAQKLCDPVVLRRIAEARALHAAATKSPTT